MCAEKYLRWKHLRCNFDITRSITADPAIHLTFVTDLSAQQLVERDIQVACSKVVSLHNLVENEIILRWRTLEIP